MGIDAPVDARILDLDPELGTGMGAEEWEEARRVCRGCIARIRPGACDLLPDVGEQGARVGLLIVEGMVCRELSVGEHEMVELLGPGDVIALPAVDGEERPLAGRVMLTAAADTVVVDLGESFLRAAARWPCLLDSVLARLEAQRERVASQGLIVHFARAEDRLLLALWLLADRWGRATPEGTVLPLALTHELLGQLTGSRRPTVTVAVSALESRGSIKRHREGSWLLTKQAERDIDAITSTNSSPGALAQKFVLRQLVVQASEHARALRAEAKQTRAQRARQRAAGSRSPDPAMTHSGARNRGGVSRVDRSERAARAAAAARAAQAGADAAQQRGQRAARRETQLAARPAPARGRTRKDTDRPVTEAATRAASAEHAAQRAEARAAEANARAAQALDDAAEGHQRAADIAAGSGDAAAAKRHRQLAARARADAQHARAHEQPLDA